LRREKAEKIKQKKKGSKHQPKEAYSKLQVSAIRPLNLEGIRKKTFQPEKVRDPRFDNLSGSLNENIFKSNYGFIFDESN